jgi:hypothetical protein
MAIGQENGPCGSIRNERAPTAAALSVACILVPSLRLVIGTSVAPDICQ